MDSHSPLFLPAHLLPEMSEGDSAMEIDLMITRQSAIYQAIDGSMSASDLLELIESQDIEIDEWIYDLDRFGYDGLL